jgi:hypothetical protein
MLASDAEPSKGCRGAAVDLARLDRTRIRAGSKSLFERVILRRIVEGAGGHEAGDAGETDL